jgi:DNA-binding TFAR19-related protein (PDSD5 family)
MQELQRRQEERKQQAEKRALLQKLLEPAARVRLGNIRAANPEFAAKIEQLILYLYQNGQIKGRIDEKTFVAILSKVSGKRETRIVRK